MSEIQLTSDHAKRLDEVELFNNGVVVAKVGFAFGLYLSKGQAVATRLALCKILREYHALCHGQLSHYLKVDANRLTMIDGEAYLDYFDEKASTISPDEPMDAMVFGYPDMKLVDEPQALAISFTASGPEPLFPHGNLAFALTFHAPSSLKKGIIIFAISLAAGALWSMPFTAVPALAFCSNTAPFPGVLEEWLPYRL